MDVMKIKSNKNVISRAWERCRSIGTGRRRSPGTSDGAFKKSKSWHCCTLEEDRKGKNKRQVAPEGCFSVYVGPQRQRFVIKTEFANHPLFKMLLEDAELEYGFSGGGPLLLPCDVDLFYKVLAEMDSGSEERSPVCSFAYSPLNLCSHYRGQNSNKGHRSYKLLIPSPLLKLNSY